VGIKAINFMNQIAAEQVNNTKQAVSWKDNPSIQKLLDVIVSILAEEYIQTARQNPAVFSKIDSGTPCPRNDQR